MVLKMRMQTPRLSARRLQGIKLKPRVKIQILLVKMLPLMIVLVLKPLAMVLKPPRRSTRRVGRQIEMLLLLLLKLLILKLVPREKDKMLFLVLLKQLAMIMITMMVLMLNLLGQLVILQWLVDTPCGL